MVNMPPLAGAAGCGAVPFTPAAKFMTGLAAAKKLKPPVAAGA